MKLIAKYKLLYGIQDAMKVRCTTSILQKKFVNQRKRIYDKVYRIETDRVTRANEGLHKCK